jgi:hypothetical protein
VADARELSPLARLIHTLQQEKIRFQVAGMSAAILQRCPATTLDTDLWLDMAPPETLTLNPETLPEIRPHSTGQKFPLA